MLIPKPETYRPRRGTFLTGRTLVPATPDRAAELVREAQREAHEDEVVRVVVWITQR